MESMNWIAAAFFLPLFPLGMIFNALFQRIPTAWGRSALILVWPLPGVWFIHDLTTDIPAWVLIWALSSSLLYGFRAGVVRELGVWTGFLATSAWVLCWIGVAAGLTTRELIQHVLAFSLPLVLLCFLANEIVRRYQSAYAGIVSGLAQAQPRLSGILVLVMLAVIGSPLFPAFFALLNSIAHVIEIMPMTAVGIAGVWLLWSWSGMRLLQELLVGPSLQGRQEDIGQLVTAAYGMSLVVLVIVGLYTLGGVL
jgi:NADH:ubiquinone oxidoreductase subunit 4 (subunit M)